MTISNQLRPTYIDHEGYRQFFHLPGTVFFGDGSYDCPVCGHRDMPLKYRKIFAREIEEARRTEEQGRE